MRTGILGGVVVAALVLSACGPNNPGAAPELASMFKFSAYPNARLIKEEVYNYSAGPISRPGTSGYREYETSDPIEKVQAYYQDLGRKNGWAITGDTELNCYNWCNLVTLTNNGFTISISRASAPTPMPTWTVPPYNTTTPSPSPSPTPTSLASPLPSATPSPSPSAVPYTIRINAYSSH